MKTRTFPILSTLFLLFLWGAMITYASSMPYTDQDLRPMLGDFNLDWVERWLGWVNFTYSTSEISVAYRGPAAFLEFFIRKGAHFFVFAALGFLLMRLITFSTKKKGIRFVLPFLIVVVVAMFDEYRHLLHPGRSGLIEDVVLDTVGGVFGMFCYATVHYLKMRKK